MSGRFASASEVIRAALMTLETNEKFSDLSVGPLEAMYPGITEKLKEGLEEARADRLRDGEEFFAELDGNSPTKFLKIVRASHAMRSDRHGTAWHTGDHGLHRCEQSEGGAAGSSGHRRGDSAGRQFSEVGSCLSPIG